MAKALRIGSMIETDKPLSDTVALLQRYREAGLDHAFASQIFGPDALTLLAVAGSQVPGIGLGTGVVPVYPRHPMMLAQQALTVQMATDNRLLLGIGLSHQVVVENMWGMSFERPAAYMREYLTALMPLLRGETVHCEGERVTTNAFAPLDISNVEAPPVLVAALGDTMLKLTGRLADGTITWMTGTATIGDHIAPTITAAAEAAGRPAPRVVVSLPISVTSDVDAARSASTPPSPSTPTCPPTGPCWTRRGRTRRATSHSSGMRRPSPRRWPGWPMPAPRTSLPPSSAMRRSRPVASRSSASSPGPERRRAAGDDAAAGSEREFGVLELVQVGHRLEEIEDALHGAGGKGDIAGGPAHETHEHGVVAHNEGRDAEDIVLTDGMLVGTSDVLNDRAGGDFGHHLVAGDADPLEHRRHDIGLPQVEPFVVPGREEGDVRIEELSGY